jgi:hypothetical protein
MMLSPSNAQVRTGNPVSGQVELARLRMPNGVAASRSITPAVRNRNIASAGKVVTAQGSCANKEQDIKINGKKNLFNYISSVILWLSNITQKFNDSKIPGDWRFYLFLWHTIGSAG